MFNHTLTTPTHTAVRPDMSEMTALGAAIAAGVGAGVWRDVTQFPQQHVSQFEPQIKPDGMNMLLWIFVLQWIPHRQGQALCKMEGGGPEVYALGEQRGAQKT